MLVSVVVMTPRRRLGRDWLVADEADLLDAGLVALVDRVDDVDAAVGQVDDARRHLGEAAAAAAIDLEDALNVGVDRGLVVGAAGLHLRSALDQAPSRRACCLR